MRGRANVLWHVGWGIVLLAWLAAPFAATAAPAAAEAADAAATSQPAAGPGGDTDQAPAPPSRSDAPVAEPQKNAEPARTELPPDVVARVNGQPITRAELADKLLKYYGERGLESIIQQVLIRQEAESLGIAAGGRDLDDAMTEFYTYGTFPQGMPLSERKKLWKDLLAGRGLTEEDFRRDLEVEVLLRKLVRRRIRISDDQVQAEFRRRHGERLRLSQIVVGGREEAEKLRERLKAGESFAELARAFSLDRPSALDGGRLPLPFRRGQSNQAYEDAAFALAPGEVSAAFETPEGWCLLRLDERLPADDVKFDAVKDRLREDLARTEEARLRPAGLAEIMKKSTIERGDLVPQKK